MLPQNHEFCRLIAAFDFRSVYRVIGALCGQIAIVAGLGLLSAAAKIAPVLCGLGALAF
jgi:hypothetical protein